MMKKFCPKCGKDTEELIENLCLDCHRSISGKEKLPLPASVKIYICKCTKVRMKNQWKSYPTLKDVIKSAILSESKLKAANISITFPKMNIAERKITIPITAEINNKGKHSTQQVDAILIPQCCPVCSRKSGGYYESVIQLRGDIKEVKKIQDYIEKRIHKENEKSDAIFITKTENVHNRIDIYLSSLKYAQKLSKHIISKFNIAEHKDSFSDYGIKDGKTLKRTTHLLRCA